MQWVEGLTLNQFVRANLDKPALLEALLQIWVRMAARLRGAGTAHGDLQHGNVLLVPGRDEKYLALKLVDYDGMFVPSLAGRPSGEVGHPNYQHPQRLREGICSAEIDRFPLLLVATVLACIKAGGRGLWEKYDSGDNLLVREADLKAPAKWALFYELLKLPDPLARGLVGHTLDALRGGLESVPLLEDVLPDRPAAVASGPARKITGAAPPPSAPSWVKELGDGPARTRGSSRAAGKSQLRPGENAEGVAVTPAGQRKRIASLVLVATVVAAAGVAAFIGWGPSVSDSSGLQPSKPEPIAGLPPTGQPPTLEPEPPTKTPETHTEPDLKEREEERARLELEKRRREFDGLVKQGETALAKQRLDEAQKEFRAALRLFLEDARALAGLAEAKAGILAAEKVAAKIAKRGRPSWRGCARRPGRRWRPRSTTRRCGS